MQVTNQLTHPGGRFGNDLQNRTRRLLSHAFEHRNRRRRAEWWATADHLVQHAAEAEQVGSLVEILTIGLLGSHIHWRPGDHPRLSHAGVVDRSSKTKVGNLNPFLHVSFQEDVSGLDIAMDQILSMRSRQPLCDLFAQPQHAAQIQRPVFFNLLLQSPARNEFHDEVRNRLFFDRVNPNDVFVSNPG